MMRRRGHRGHLPSKSVPNKRRQERVVVYEERNAGINYGNVDVDAVMKDKFNPEDYITNVPWGSNPFGGDVTALRKKAVYRPTANQMDAIQNKVKHSRVSMQSGISGETKVKHPTRFIAKNETSIPITTNPILHGPVEHEKVYRDKRGKTLEQRSGKVVDFTDKTQASRKGNTRSRQKSINPQAIPEIIGFIPVFSANVSTNNRKYQARAESKHSANVRFSDDVRSDVKYVDKPRKRNQRRVSEKAQRNVEIEDTKHNRTSRKSKNTRKQRDVYNSTVTDYENYQDVDRAKSRKSKNTRKQRSSKYKNADPEYETTSELGDIVNWARKSKNNKKQREGKPKKTNVELDVDERVIPTYRELKSKKQREGKPKKTNVEIEVVDTANSNKVEKSNRKTQNDGGPLESVPELDSRRNDITLEKSNKKKTQNDVPLVANKDLETDIVIKSKDVKPKSKRKQNNLPITAPSNVEVSNTQNIVVEKPKQKSAKPGPIRTRIEIEVANDDTSENGVQPNSKSRNGEINQDIKSGGNANLKRRNRK